MPGSAFFSKEAIAAAGLEIIRKQGIGALFARAPSKQLGCSLSPVFTCGIAVLATQSPEDYPEEMFG